MEIKKVNLVEKLTTFTAHWNPMIVGRMNNQLVKIVKVKGEFITHKHDDEDELFFVIKGELCIELEDKIIKLLPGEFVIIPKGTLHKPYAKEESHVMMFEPASTLNTGDKVNEFTIRQNELKEI